MLKTPRKQVTEEQPKFLFLAFAELKLSLFVPLRPFKQDKSWLSKQLWVIKRQQRQKVIQLESGTLLETQSKQLKACPSAPWQSQRHSWIAKGLELSLLQSPETHLLCAHRKSSPIVYYSKVFLPLKCLHKGKPNTSPSSGCTSSLAGTCFCSQA